MIKESILELIKENHWAGKEVFSFETIDSTNDEAKRKADEGAPHGTLVVAKTQTAGRGRRGRCFDSPKQAGVWMSLVIKDDIEPANASMLTLVMGLAVAKAIEELVPLHPQIKWPNDLILQGKKVCGILTEMSLQMDKVGCIIIGVGINVGTESFPEEIRDVATSIWLECNEKVSHSKLIGQVLRQFETYYDVFMKTQDLSGLMDAYNECLINRGRQVTVLAPKGEYQGLALGINAEGELLVETKDQVHKVSSGEVSVRGVLGYV